MKLRLSPAAKADLRSIWNYTANTWSVSQADRYVNSLREACSSLIQPGSRGRPAHHILSGYMYMTVGSHFIFYRQPDPDSVVVMRILHQRMDIEIHLRG